MPIFDSKSLHDAVSEQLKASNIPSGDKNAFAVVVTKTGVKAVLSTKVNDHWEISSVFNIDHQKHIDGGIEVKTTW